MVMLLDKGRSARWTRAWVFTVIVWAALVVVWQYPYSKQNLTLEGVQSHHLEYLFNDLVHAIDRAEGGRLTSQAVEKAADAVLGNAGRTIAGFELLSKDPRKIVQRMKRVPYAAPENDMQVRWYVFPVETPDSEIAAALATESSRRQITERARTEPPRLDLLMANATDARPGAEIFELETTKLLGDYYHAVERLPGDRFEFLLICLALLLIPSIGLYAIGSSVGWAVNGFHDTRAIHYIGAVLFAAVVWIIAALALSQVESRFQCSGQISSKWKTDSEPITVYAKLTTYRLWLIWWVDSDSDGRLWLEIPNRAFDTFQIARVGDDMLTITDIREGQPRLKGQFSLLSSTLALDTSVGFFDGKCARIE